MLAKPLDCQRQYRWCSLPLAFSKAEYDGKACSDWVCLSLSWLAVAVCLRSTAYLLCRLFTLFRMRTEMVM